MSLPFFVAIGTTIFFGLVAVYFSTREEKLRKELKKREDIQKRRLYEIATLRAIQDRIGYSLDIERVIDTLTGSLKNLFPYSTASSLLIEPNKLVFKTAIEEPISRIFIDEVKKSMVASLGALLNKPLPEYVEEVRTGTIPDNNNKQILASFFHIPLVVNGQIVGLINVSSTTPGLYKDEDMTILYQMTTIASNALSKLRDVITTEETKLLAMIGSLSDGLLFLDKSMQLTLVNSAAKKFLDVADKNQLTYTEILPILNKAISENTSEDLSAVITIAMQKYETRVFEKIMLGTKILRLLIIPVIEILDGAQTVVGTTLVLHDITLQESLNTLKDDFTNGLVHELRSPLTAIKYSADLLLSEKTLGASDERLLTIIDEQTKRMLSDINGLLDAAKIDAGKFTIEKKPEDIQEVIHSTIELFQAEALEKHIILTSDISPVLPKASIDKMRIEETLQNILSNSLNYTPSGGTIHVTATLVHHEHLPPSPTNPGILISITDTGSGIPKEKQVYLFSKFAQVGTTHLPHAQQGTGLGLYIAKGIVTAHGGQIYLTSEEGKGTTVSFILPMENQQLVNSTQVPIKV